MTDGQHTPAELTILVEAVDLERDRRSGRGCVQLRSGVGTEEDVASFVNGVVDREDLRMVVDHHRNPTHGLAAQVPIARDQ